MTAGAFSSVVCLIVSAALLVIATPFNAHARPLPQDLATNKRAVRLEPTSPWHLEMADNICRLTRRFDSVKGPGFLMFEQHAPGRFFDITVAGPDFATGRNGAWLYVGMRSDVQMATIDALEFGMTGFEEALNISNVTLEETRVDKGTKRRQEDSRIDPAIAELVERIVIQRSTTITSFEAGNMGKAFSALNDCSRDLMSGHPIDLAAHSNFHPPIMPDASIYFARLSHKLANTTGNQGNQSLLRIRAMVSSDGSVTECFHEYAFSSGGLQPNVCEDIRGMQFEPAIDSAGTPMNSFYSRSIKLSRYGAWNAGADGGTWGDTYER